MVFIAKAVSAFDSLLRNLKTWFRKELPMSIHDQGRMYETTGVHVMKGGKPRTIENTGNVLLVEYDDESHKLWRAQEFTLFFRNKPLLKHPILDLGCGDGSFASVLFDSVDYGVDPDSGALEIADSLKIYGKTLNTTADDMDIEPESIESVISNSVLEHTVNLEKILKEVNRILTKNGVFMFTVPNREFTLIMSRLFGKKEAKRLNETVFFHRNLLSNEEWTSILKQSGFTRIVMKNYQPIELNYVFRMLRSPVIKRVNKLIRMWNNSDFIELVERSLECNCGAGTFVIAKK